MVAVVPLLALTAPDVENLGLGPATYGPGFKSQVCLLPQVMLGASSHLFEPQSPHIHRETQAPT